MLHEIDAGKFPAARGLFRECKQYVPVFAVLDGLFPGRVFVDDHEQPAFALVWAVSRWSYVEGDPANAAFLNGLAPLVGETVIPRSLTMGMDWFEIYAPNDPAWIDAVPAALGDLNPEMHFEDTSVLNEERWRKRDRTVSLPDGASIQKVDIPIVPSRAEGAAFVPESFMSRTAFGFQAVAGDRVISWCRSNGFAAGAEFMVDVETFSKDDRCKGFATAVGDALIEYSLANGLSPLWETTHWNVASQKVAEKLGFEKKETYPVFGVVFGDRRSE